MKTKQSKSTKKNRQPQGINSLARPLKMNSTQRDPYFDRIIGVTGVSTSAVQISLLDALLNSSGLLQQFPSHSTPVFANGSFFLRQNLRLLHMEVKVSCVGSQGSILGVSDLYNNLRFAVYRSGGTFINTTANYLSAVMNGGGISDVQHVYVDKVAVLPSPSWDVSSTTNTPMVRHYEYRIPLNLSLEVYSSNASGSGATWETREMDLMMAWVSDSSVAPNPTIQSVVRVFFKYV